MVASSSYQVLTFNLAAASVRKVSHNGRDYLVAPASLIVPGVLNGSDGPGYYPPDETSRNVASWDDMPIVVYHPTKDGQPIAAQDPQHREHVGKSTVGFLKNTRFKDRLLSEAWFDKKQVENYDAQLPQWAKMLPRLNSNTPIEVSTGLHVDRDETPGVCPKTGRPYNWVARNHRPDHLAVLPDQKGACSVADGCGVVMNTENSNPEGVNQYTKGGSARFEGKAADGTVEGGFDVKIIDPHSNAHEVGKTEGKGKKARMYDKNGYSHIPMALVERPEQKRLSGEIRPAKQFQAYHHTLRPIQNAAKEESEGRWVTLPNGAHIQIKDGEIVKGPKIDSKKKDFRDKTSDAKTTSLDKKDKSSTWEKSGETSKGSNTSERDLSKGGPSKPDFRDRVSDAKVRPGSVKNAGKFGNPQHLETGKFQPHGSGTGKGEVHEAAKEGRHGKKCECGSECEKCKQSTTNGDMTMATTKLPETERQGLVNKIVANCDCHESEQGKALGIVNQFSDATLMKLNAMMDSKDDNSKVESAVESEPEPKDKKEKEAVPPQFAKNQQAEFESQFVKNLGFESLGHIKATLNVAKKVEYRERKALLERIVANVETSKKESVWNRYKERDLEELQGIVDLLPVRQVANQDEQRIPNYSGAPGYTAPVENAGGGEEDILDTPVMNWKD